jgi:hypothetical protein
LLLLMVFHFCSEAPQRGLDAKPDRRTAARAIPLAERLRGRERRKIDGGAEGAEPLHGVRQFSCVVAGFHALAAGTAARFASLRGPCGSRRKAVSHQPLPAPNAGSAKRKGIEGGEARDRVRERSPLRTMPSTTSWSLQSRRPSRAMTGDMRRARRKTGPGAWPRPVGTAVSSARAGGASRYPLAAPRPVRTSRSS